MGMAADMSGIQFRKLNTSKGPSVQATRVQADKIIYQNNIKKLLYKNKNLDIFQQKVINIKFDTNNNFNVITESNISFFSKSLVLTLGTFLNGEIYIGLNNKIYGGRYGDSTNSYLSDKLKNIFFKSIRRFKTGTPPRIDLRSINFKLLDKQYSDFPLPTFSFYLNRKKFLKQMPCYITNTNIETHKIILDNINKSPIYNNLIKSSGPRYCPSIEDKVIKFHDKKSHQIFLEPEGLNSNEIYPNGISTSLPIETQISFIRSIKGLEKSKITRPGYAVEYDFFDPINLNLTLESKIIRGLFLAGQINGTTGYEEAAAQGIIAGINSSRFSKNMDFWFPLRNESYIGVMLDDLCKKGVIEPYRMFTSRAEYRLSLRESNADLRLSDIGYKLGLISLNKWKKFCLKKEIIEKEKNRLKSTLINIKDINLINLNNKLCNKITNNISGYDLLRNQEINYEDLNKIDILKPLLKDNKIFNEIETQIKYEYYIYKQNKEIENINKYLNIHFPKNINFNKINGLSNEVICNLNRFKPKSLGEMLNISGITYSSIFIIKIWLKNNNFI
ncbi:tRNA uridine-5-carboxymethylaminomethyl(34) synthesis enzyme MnmG [endosymbiont of Pachyrhynchus infernalis]